MDDEEAFEYGFNVLYKLETENLPDKTISRYQCKSCGNWAKFEEPNGTQVTSWVCGKCGTTNETQED